MAQAAAHRQQAIENRFRSSSHAEGFSPACHTHHNHLLKEVIPYE
jgi:hypothetical protein